MSLVLHQELDKLFTVILFSVSVPVFISDISNRSKCFHRRKFLQVHYFANRLAPKASAMVTSAGKASEWRPQQARWTLTACLK
jgi:hypothetical protein